MGVLVFLGACCTKLIATDNLACDFDQSAQWEYQSAKSTKQCTYGENHRDNYPQIDKAVGCDSKAGLILREWYKTYHDMICIDVVVTRIMDFLVMQYNASMINCNTNTESIQYYMHTSGQGDREERVSKKLGSRFSLRQSLTTSTECKINMKWQLYLQYSDTIILGQIRYWAEFQSKTRYRPKLLLQRTYTVPLVTSCIIWGESVIFPLEEVVLDVLQRNTELDTQSLLQSKKSDFITLFHALTTIRRKLIWAENDQSRLRSLHGRIFLYRFFVRLSGLAPTLRLNKCFVSEFCSCWKKWVKTQQTQS